MSNPQQPQPSHQNRQANTVSLKGQVLTFVNLGSIGNLVRATTYEEFQSAMNSAEITLTQLSTFCVGASKVKLENAQKTLFEKVEAYLKKVIEHRSNVVE